MYKVLGIIAAALVLTISGFIAGKSSSKQEVAKVHQYYYKILADLAVKTEAARVEFETLETLYKTEISKVDEDAKDKIHQLESSIPAADAANAGLRESAGKRAASAKTAFNSASAEEREAAAKTLDLFADLLAASNEICTEYAEYADRARIAGEACEQSYEVIYANQYKFKESK